MIGYSMLNEETVNPQKITPTPVRQQKSLSLYKVKTECDMIILGFVLATMLLLLSDLFPTRT